MSSPYNSWPEARIVCSRHYRALHLVLDLGALTLAWYATRELRLILNPYMATWIEREDFDTLAPPLGALLAMWVLAAVWRGLYRPSTDASRVAGLLRVAESATLVSALVIILTFFSRQIGADLSRSFVLLFAPVSFLCLSASFLLSAALARWIERRWPEQKRVAILGAGRVAQKVVEAIQRSKEASALLCGVILPADSATVGPCGTAVICSQALPVLGTTRELAEVINREDLDRIILACETLTEPEFEHCGEITKRMGVTVSQPIPTNGNKVQLKFQSEYGLHLIDMDEAPFWRARERVKAALDFAIALVLITVLLPLFAAIVCLIRLTSDGPVLYKSRRVGRGGRHFTFWKFRTMYVNGPSRRELARYNERSGALFKIRRDPRVTPVGRVLRRLSLDELPQLFNVVAGDMSLVGPRPLPIEDLDPDGMSRKFARWAWERAHVKPGITGLWQVRGRSDVPFPQMVEMDLEYVHNWSLKLDLSILLATPLAVVSGRGAY